MNRPLLLLLMATACGGATELAVPDGSAPDLTCATTPTITEDPCGAASRFLIEPIGVELQGTSGTLRLRYHNGSSNVPWAYPTVHITANDDRIGAFGDGPDLYGLGTCGDSTVIERSFSVSPSIPSGSSVRFTLTPGVINEQNTQCTLTSTTIDAVAQ